MITIDNAKPEQLQAAQGVVMRFLQSHQKEIALYPPRKNMIARMAEIALNDGFDAVTMENWKRAYESSEP